MGRHRVSLRLMQATRHSTGQLLAFARRQALKPELFDVAEQVEFIADMLRTVVGARIEVVIETACRECFVEAGLVQFETALVNMAVNAREAMHGDGTLSVKVDGSPESPAVCRW